MVHHIFFNHVWGSTEQSDLTITKPMACVYNDDEGEAVEEGWLAQDEPHRITTRRSPEEVFYQSRSTRINLQKWKPKFKRHYWNDKPLEMMQIHPTEKTVVMTGMHKVYQRYLERKGYKDLYNPLKHIHKRDSFIIYFQEDPGNILGFTKLKYYSIEWPTAEEYMGLPKELVKNQRLWPINPVGAVETYMHCNTVEISQLTLDMECKFWEAKGAPYLYTGPGYEKSSVYKSHWAGFEWWTGFNWSRDVERFRKLCYRDSKIKSIEDLGRAKF